MHMNSTGKLALVIAVVLSLGLARASAGESRVVRDEITGFELPQVVAAVKSAMEKEGCHIDAEKTFKGSGIEEIKCTIGEEKVTVQADRQSFTGASLRGDTVHREFISVWIKTSGGKKIWSKIIDQDINDALRKPDSSHTP
jgi:hypothetical protein